MTGAIFGPSAARRIVRAVRQVERMSPPGGGRGWAHRPTWQIPLIVEGTLDGNLDAATSITGTKTATLSVYRFNSGGTFADTTENITVTNRNTNFSASSGDYLMAEYQASEWRPVGGSGSSGAGPAFDVVQVTSTTHSATPTGNVFYVCSTVEAGGAIALTINAATEDADGAEIVIKNWESGTGSANVTCTLYDDRDVDADAGTTEGKTITPGTEARAIWSYNAVRTDSTPGPEVTGAWIWVS